MSKKVKGSEFNDELEGLEAKSDVFGLDGNDSLTSIGKKLDNLFGGNGDDYLETAIGQWNQEFTNAYKTTLDGGSGNDLVQMELSDTTEKAILWILLHF